MAAHRMHDHGKHPEFERKNHIAKAQDNNDKTKFVAVGHLAKETGSSTPFSILHCRTHTLVVLYS